MNHSMSSCDVAVIGAGAAGLQAAQTLGRMRLSALVFDSGRYRNDPAVHMHNFLGHDGTPPAQLRAAARADAGRYDSVRFAGCGVVRIAGEAGAFRLETGDGPAVTARRVLLATGVVDSLPEVPGLAPLFGDVVAHCPFCHGHEFAGMAVGVLGIEAHVARLAAMMAPVAGRLVVLADGGRPDAETAAALDRLGVELRPEAVRGVCRSGTGLAVELEGRAPLELGGLFVKTDWRQAAPFAAQLGLEMAPSGAVIVDAFGRTSRAGVYAAGDMAQGPGLPMPMASVLNAASAGLLAAAACVQDAALDRLGSGR
jgi:thioredoxin reductase